MMFKNRVDAGQKLGFALHRYKEQNNTVILGLARGGIVVAAEVAKELNLPLYVIIPRKIGSPYNPELAIGAIMEGGEKFLNNNMINALGISNDYVAQEIKKEEEVARARYKLYQPHNPIPNLEGKTVILVDDGIATGATMFVAVKTMRKAKVGKVIVAVPVSATDTLKKMGEEVDEMVCLYDTDDFPGVGAFYEKFFQVEDEQIIALLNSVNKDHS